MSTKTVLAAAAFIAAVLIGGAVIWAVSDDGATRAAALESTQGPTPFTLQLGPEINGGQPFAVSSYAIGARRGTGSTTEKTTTGAAAYEPLEVTKPMDGVSVDLVKTAVLRRIMSMGILRLSRQTEEGSFPLLNYELTQASVRGSDEGASDGNRARQAVSVGFTGLALIVPSGSQLDYAPPTNAVGELEIPLVTDSQSKPAHVMSYSWGWSIVPNTTPVVKSLTLTRQLDRHAVWFWQQLVTGKLVPEMRLRLVANSPETGEPQTYLTYILRDVIVSAVQDSGGETPVEQVTLDFRRIETDAEGKSYLWDLAATKTIY
jgi:type VI protein secretion system component Hcp